MKKLCTALLIALLTALLPALVMTGCNTMEGLGKDIQKAGDAIEGAAKKK